MESPGAAAGQKSSPVKSSKELRGANRREESVNGAYQDYLREIG